jgi:hypothetical protein
VTRNSEIDCEDLFGCDHEPETPIADDSGAIVSWRCRCGRHVAAPTPPVTDLSGEA